MKVLSIDLDYIMYPTENIFSENGWDNHPMCRWHMFYKDNDYTEDDLFHDENRFTIKFRGEGFLVYMDRIFYHLFSPSSKYSIISIHNDPLEINFLQSLQSLQRRTFILFVFQWFTSNGYKSVNNSTVLNIHINPNH